MGSDSQFTTLPTLDGLSVADCSVAACSIWKQYPSYANNFDILLLMHRFPLDWGIKGVWDVNHCWMYFTAFQPVPYLGNPNLEVVWVLMFGFSWHCGSSRSQFKQPHDAAPHVLTYCCTTLMEAGYFRDSDCDKPPAVWTNFLWEKQYVSLQAGMRIVTITHPH